MPLNDRILRLTGAPENPRLRRRSSSLIARAAIVGEVPSAVCLRVTAPSAPPASRFMTASLAIERARIFPKTLAPLNNRQAAMPNNSRRPIVPSSGNSFAKRTRERASALSFVVRRVGKADNYLQDKMREFAPLLLLLLIPMYVIRACGCPFHALRSRVAHFSPECERERHTHTLEE